MTDQTQAAADVARLQASTAPLYAEVLEKLAQMAADFGLDDDDPLDALDTATDEAEEELRRAEDDAYDRGLNPRRAAQHWHRNWLIEHGE